MGILWLSVSIVLAMGPGPAWAADFHVSTFKDDGDVAPGDAVCATESGDCSIRAAIEEANALPGADTVTIGAGRARLLGSMTITDDLKLLGADAELTILQGNRSERVLAVAAGVTAEIAHLTIKNGGRESGSGIYNLGELTLRDSILTKNVTELAAGGALYNGGEALLERVTFIGNVGLWGGALYNASAATIHMADVTVRRNRHIVDGGGAGLMNVGTATLERCSFLRNQARIGLGGGAIYNSGSVYLTNVTISRNRARLSTAGGLLNDGFASLTNVTLVKNQARFVSGGLVNNGTAAVRNTILSENFNNRVRNVNCGGGMPVVSLGYNIDSGAVCSLFGPGDMSNTNPDLRGEEFNGGLTRSRALSEGSPAVDAGDPAECPAEDQRGKARPLDGDGDGHTRCDIGAFELELEPNSAALFVDASLSHVDARCRAALGAGARKLATTYVRELLKCEKNRMSGKIDEEINCQVDLPARASATLDRATARLLSSIQNKCDESSSAGVLGYWVCPSPCESTSLATHDDVAKCLACVTKAQVASSVGGIFGGPDAPFSSSDAGRCFDRASKAFTKYFTKRLQFAQKCQGDIDLGKISGVTDCAADDFRGRIEKARTTAMRLLDGCAEEAMPALDLCAADLDGLKACMRSAIDEAVDPLFRATMPRTANTAELAEKFDTLRWLHYVPRDIDAACAGDGVSPEEIAADLGRALDVGFTGVVSDRLSCGLEQFPGLARDAGFVGVVAGVSLEPSLRAAEERAALAAADDLDGIVAGMGELVECGGSVYNADALVSVLLELKNATGVAVGTSEMGPAYTRVDPCAGGAMLRWGDFSMPLTQPFADGIDDPHDAAFAARNVLLDVRDFTGRPSLLRSVGWPTIGHGAASEANQDEFYDWLASFLVRYSAGDTFDRSAAPAAPPWDGAWGLWMADGTPKQHVAPAP